VKDPRPINLNLFTVRFPIPAIVSILHRISGVILFLIIPFLIWGLNLSLTSFQDYENLRDFLTTPLMKFILWGVLAAFIYHMIAGIRHLFMDMGIGESLKGGRFGAKLTLVISLILIVLVGIWLW
jgi:succinate dehydrogenase / fumarate reductase cytochrome b subunit